MKKGNKLFRFASVTALPVLAILIVLSGATMLTIRASKDVQALGFPGFFKTLFDYSIYDPVAHSQRFLGQLLSNMVAYIFMLAALIMFIISLCVIRHNKEVKAKAAILSLLLVVPAVVGLAGGAVNFFGEGLRKLLKIGANGALMSFLYCAVLGFDILYWVLVIIYLAGAVPTAHKINKGILPPDFSLEPDRKVVVAKQEPEERKALLDDIRKIVREELERLDRVAIVKEEVVVKEVAKVVEKKPAPKPAPVVEPEPEEEVEVEKKKSAPRIPFANKMVKADKDIQEKYTELKKDLLAYGASSRVSVAGDTFRLHRKPYVKITLVGKTMKVYFALDPKDFVDSPIPVYDASDKVAYEEVPALLRVKSNLSVKRAKDLAEMAFAKDGFKKEKEVEDHNFIKDLRAEIRNKK